MKRISFKIEFEYDLIEDKHKIVAVITSLIKENRKINKTTIKEELENASIITGFYYDISFITALSSASAIDDEHCEIDEDLVLKAIELFNKIYKQKITREDLE